MRSSVCRGNDSTVRAAKPLVPSSRDTTVEDNKPQPALQAGDHVRLLKEWSFFGYDGKVTFSAGTELVLDRHSKVTGWWSVIHDKAEWGYFWVDPLVIELVAEPGATPQCSCSIDTLMAQGCRCGGR